MLSEHLKCSLPLPTGHIVGKMHMSSKCTQHVITGFQAPLPPVTLVNLAHLNGRFTTAGFFERVFTLASKTKKGKIPFGIQLPDVLALQAPKDIRSAITSRDASSSMEVIGDEVGHVEEAVRAVVRRVLFREDRMADW